VLLHAVVQRLLLQQHDRNKELAALPLDMRIPVPAVAPLGADAHVPRRVPAVDLRSGALPAILLRIVLCSMLLDATLSFSLHLSLDTCILSPATPVTDTTIQRCVQQTIERVELEVSV